MFNALISQHVIRDKQVIKCLNNLVYQWISNLNWFKY